MKYKRWGLWVFLFALAFAFMFGGCGGGDGSSGGGGYNPSPGGRKLTVTPSSLTLAVGDVRTLQAGNNVGPLTWYSANEAVAKVARTNVSATTVTAVGPGTAIIYVSDQSTKGLATCTVKVTGGTTPSPTPTPTLTVTPSTLSLEVGKTETLTAANYMGNLTWISDKTNIASVAANGVATATVTAVAAGTAKITVTDGSGTTASCAVTVTAAGSEPEPEPTTPEFFVISDDHVLVENPVLQPNVYPLQESEIVSFSFADEKDKSSGIAPA
jgi:uncharacterized protein YjdB